jgi:hypothetical protein
MPHPPRLNLVSNPKGRTTKLGRFALLLSILVYEEYTAVEIMLYPSCFHETERIQVCEATEQETLTR